MSDKSKGSITVEVETLDRTMRRLFALKELVDVAIESVAELMVQGRPKGSSPAAGVEPPPTFGSRQPVESSADVPGWQQQDVS
jgi:hypothetical protein